LENCSSWFHGYSSTPSNAPDGILNPELSLAQYSKQKWRGNFTTVHQATPVSANPSVRFTTLERGSGSSPRGQDLASQIRGIPAASRCRYCLVEAIGPSGSPDNEAMD
jgi:hypothetical protein